MHGLQLWVLLMIMIRAMSRQCFYQEYLHSSARNDEHANVQPIPPRGNMPPLGERSPRCQTGRSPLQEELSRLYSSFPVWSRRGLKKLLLALCPLPGPSLGSGKGLCPSVLLPATGSWAQEQLILALCLLLRLRTAPFGEQPGLGQAGGVFPHCSTPLKGLKQLFLLTPSPDWDLAKIQKAGARRRL